MLLYKLQQLLRASGCFHLYCQMAWIHPGLSFALQPRVSYFAAFVACALMLFVLLWDVLARCCVWLLCIQPAWPILAVVLAACPANNRSSTTASSAALPVDSKLASAPAAATAAAVCAAAAAAAWGCPAALGSLNAAAD
jgi:hypothetical protein